ncbi:MAG: sarcosine oxidase subunit gamma [Pikeienuella sp.]
MAETVARNSALAGRTEPRHLGIIGADGPGLRLSERAVDSLWLVGAWPGHLPSVGEAVSAAIEVGAAPGPGRAAFGARGMALRVEPAKWLVAGDNTLIRPDVAPEAGTVLDLSHARTVIRIDGRMARALMARLVAIDLRPGQFEDGTVAATGIEGMGVTLLARAGGIELLVFRSFAAALWDLMLDTGAQFGVEIS